jgi:hypothetical protein
MRVCVYLPVDVYKEKCWKIKGERERERGKMSDDRWTHANTLNPTRRRSASRERHLFSKSKKKKNLGYIFIHIEVRERVTFAYLTYGNAIQRNVYKYLLLYSFEVSSILDRLDVIDNSDSVPGRVFYNKYLLIYTTRMKLWIREYNTTWHQTGVR